MKRRMILATVVMAAILVSVIGISALGGEKGVSAANHTLEYQYHVSLARSLINPLCDQSAPADAAAPDGAFALCPDMATPGESVSGKTNDQSIEIKGNGTLSINASDGSPNTVTGGCFFIHKSGSEAVVGRWEAKQLLMFETYGPGDAELLGDAFPDLDIPFGPLEELSFKSQPTTLTNASRRTLKAQVVLIAPSYAFYSSRNVTSM